MTLKKIPTLGGAPVALTSTEVDDARSGLGFNAVDSRLFAVDVHSNDSAATVKTKVETLLPFAVAADSPVGFGRLVRFPSDEVISGRMSLSTMQSLEGIKGASQVKFDPTGLTAGTYGHLELQNDSLSKNGIRGNGTIRDLDFNGNRSAWEASYPGVAVDGYYAADRAGGVKCISHRMDNVAAHNYTRHGFYIGVGNDQLVMNRVRSEGCKGFAMVLSASDIKASDLGLNGDGGALNIVGCAPEISTVDLFMGSVFTGEGTLHITDSVGPQIKGGTVDGRTIIRGRNDSGVTHRYENSRILLEKMVFKHSQTLNSAVNYAGGTPLYVYDSYVVVEDADGVQLVLPRFIFDETLAASTLPDYLIKVASSTGQEQRNGKVFLSQAKGLVHIMGRPGAPGGAMRQLMGCKKHWANRPDLTAFDWGAPGQVEFVPAWCVNAADPTLRTHVAFDGVTNYPKVDYPWGYLAATINKGVGGIGTPGTNGTLDDAATTFTLPYIPNQHADYGVAAMRILP